MLENSRKRQSIKLRTSDKLINRILSNTCFINRNFFDENLVAIHRINETISLNKPIYVGDRKSVV